MIPDLVSVRLPPPEQVVHAITRLEAIELQLVAAAERALTLPLYLQTWWNKMIGRLRSSEKGGIFLDKLVLWFTQEG